jgi:hypothetical protein
MYSSMSPAPLPPRRRRIQIAQAGGVRRQRAVEGGAGLGQVARGRQPEVERPQQRRRDLEHLQEPPRRRDRKQVEPHRERAETAAAQHTLLLPACLISSGGAVVK